MTTHRNMTHGMMIKDSYEWVPRAMVIELTRTLCDDPLQTYDVLVGELAHDAGLAQEFLPLLFTVAWFQGLYRNCNLGAAR